MYDLSAFKLPPGNPSLGDVTQTGPKDLERHQSLDYQLAALRGAPEDTIWTDDPDMPVYPSLAREGLVSVDLPGRPGRGNFGIERPAIETMLAKDVPGHIATQVERAFRTSPSEAIATLDWYTGSIKGANLLDARSIDRLDKLNRSFASASKPEELFTSEVQPFLSGLKPQRRG
jgi:hypothetical protein